MKSIVLAVMMCVAAAELGYIWQLTDTHLLPGYLEGADVPQEKCLKKLDNSTRKAGKFSDYGCDSAYTIIDSAFDQIISKKYTGGKEPDFVFWTGDHTSMKDKDIGQAQSLKYIANITNQLRMLKKALPNTKIFPMLGNHDSYPVFQWAERGPWYVYDYVAEEWKDFLSADALTTVKKCLYYTEVMRPGLRLVALNTMMYYFLNRMTNDNMTDPGDQLAWLKTTLTNARQNGERVLLMSHFPPGRNTISFGGIKEFYPKLHDKWIRVMSDFHDIIIGGIYGHDHINSFHLVYEVDGEKHNFNGKGSVHFESGSITPEGTLNPSLHLFTFEKAAPFTLVDKIVHYLDLKKANDEKVISWDKRFALSDYGVNKITVEEMAKLVDRMEANVTLLNEFRATSHGMSDTKNFDVNTDDKRKKTFCHYRNALYTASAACDGL